MYSSHQADAFAQAVASSAAATDRAGANEDAASAARWCAHAPTPAGASFLRTSTDRIAPAARFDFWRQLSAAAVTEPAAAIGAAGYHGELQRTTPWQGAVFLRIGNDPMFCRFTEPDADGITVLRVCAGTVHVRSHGGATTRVDAGTGFVLFDRNRPVELIEPSRFVMTGLKVPRALIAAALGCTPAPSAPAIRPFARPGPLVVGLQRQFDVLAEQARGQDGADPRAAMATARSLVMILLARRNPHPRTLPEAFDTALLAVARHQLELCAGDPCLTADDVAAMLGCSRARLYQLFKREGTTVGEVLRDARLQRAVRLLRSEARIGEIAWRCGYAEFSAFDRAFRRRFGLTPGDYRRYAAAE